MLFLTEFEFEYDGLKKAILIDIPENSVPNEIASELHTQYRGRLLAVDLILLRPSVWAFKDLEASIKGVDKICERFPGVSVKLLISNDYKHLVVDSSDDRSTQKFRFENRLQPFLNKLRTTELKQLVKQSEALYLSDSDYIFRLPSRILSDSFLRVGNIQTSRGALDSLLFWLLPHIKDVEGILIDTWSISSIALNASRFLSMYKSETEAVIKVEMLDNYLDRRMETREELEEVLRQVSDGFQKPFLIFFSATMTGKSLEYFSSALSNLGCPTELYKFLILFRLGDSPIKVNDTIIPELCDLSSEVPSITKWSDQEGRTKIKIDPTTYFPTFANEKEVRLTKLIAAKHKTFFNRYRDQKAIRIHADSWVGGQKFRHHGIYVDVLQMLENKYFFSKFKRIIENLDPPPKMILIPPHDAGKRLAEIAAERLAKIMGQSPKIIEHLDLQGWDDDVNGNESPNKMKEFHQEIKQINEDEALLILDDVITTGSRFLGYQKRLRQLEFKGQIHYRAGVSRTFSVEKRQEIAQTLKPNSTGPDHTLEFVEEVILPDWDKTSCPLCIENSLLASLIMQEATPPSSILADRANQLRNATDKGLVEDVFFRLPSTQPLQITRDSFFVKEGATEAIVLSSVAAAIQELRTNIDINKRLDAHGFPVRKVFSVEDFQRYTDGILQASLLRCLVAEEFHKISPEKDKQFVNWARRIFTKTDPDSRSMQPELALGIGLRKIPVETVDADFGNSIVDRGLSQLLPIIQAG